MEQRGRALARLGRGLRQLGRAPGRRTRRVLWDPEDPANRPLRVRIAQRPAWGALARSVVLPILPAGVLTLTVAAAVRAPDPVRTPWWAGPLELLTLVVSYVLLTALLLHLQPWTRAYLQRQRAWGRMELPRAHGRWPGWRRALWVEAYVLRRGMDDLLGPRDE